MAERGENVFIHRLARRERNFLIVDTGYLEDRRLSMAAKGLLTWRLTKPADWKTYIAEITKAGKDGKHAVRTALNELRDAGYSITLPVRNAGKVAVWDTHFFETPELTAAFKLEMAARSASPESENQTLVKKPEATIRKPASGAKPESGFQDLGFQEVGNQPLLRIDTNQPLKSTKDEPRPARAAEGGDKKSSGGSRSKAGDGAHPRLIKVFCDAWEKRHGTKYTFIGGKDGAHVKLILDNVDEAEAVAIVTRYMADNDQFVAVKQCHSLGELVRNLNKYRVPGASNGKHQQPAGSHRGTVERLSLRA